MFERRSDSDPEALRALGSSKKLAVNMEKLQSLPQAKFKPLVEYLTGIQSQRGENHSLVFVRSNELDLIASLAGESEEGVLAGFEELGVVMSTN
ncbi:MAG: hypothetical protein ABIS18_08075 [Actinomycetota bacterium]